jgi:hypothetical protein
MKIESLSNKSISEIRFVINDPDANKQKTEFHYSLIGNQDITDLLIYIESEINKLRNKLYPNTFLSTVSYYSNLMIQRIAMIIGNSRIIGLIKITVLIDSCKL